MHFNGKPLSVNAAQGVLANDSDFDVIHWRAPWSAM